MGAFREVRDGLGSDWLAEQATVYNPRDCGAIGASLGPNKNGPDKNGKPVDSGMLRTCDALQHVHTKKRHGLRIAGMHGLQ
jgi:hypothetical protein